LIVKDQKSYDEMAAHFPNNTVLLIPDMAFMLGHKIRPRPPKYDFLFLMRTDSEKNANVSVDHSVIPSSVTYLVLDWIYEDVCLFCLLVCLFVCLFVMFCFVMFV
jgi:exopolysaccharide biosynthesis predicted pyruvyltransferase EpsI